MPEAKPEHVTSESVPQENRITAYPLEGLVETGWSVASFTMNWMLTRPRHTVRFAKDEPICMLVPQKRSELEIFEAEIRNIESDPDLNAPAGG